MGMCDSGPSPMRVFTVTGTDDALDHHARHRDHGRRIPQPAGARAAPGDLRHPAAAVDVDEDGAGALGEARRLGEALGVGAVDLDGGELVVVGELDLAARVAAPAQQALDVDELGHRDGGARACAQSRRNTASVTSSMGARTTGLRVEGADAVVGRGHEQA